VSGHRATPTDLLGWVERATLAPSSHNTQPWLFRLGTQWIDLFADRTRALPVNDPFDRELLISCGAALGALRVAAAGAGQGVAVSLLPDTAEPDWLARVMLSAEAADAGLAALSPVLESRHTHRRAFLARPVESSVRRAVGAAAKQEGAELVDVDGRQREAVAELVAEGDRLQWADPCWRRELAMWMHPRRRGDGLALPALAAPIAQALVRRFDMGRGVAAKDAELATASPWLSVLATPEDSPMAWLQAGQALQCALLTGGVAGLQASYLNQPIEVTALRPRLQHLLHSQAFPQLLLRWGYPEHTLQASPRRALADVIEAER
jgi:hypothetical protein